MITFNEVINIIYNIKSDSNISIKVKKCKVLLEIEKLLENENPNFGLLSKEDEETLKLFINGKNVDNIEQVYFKSLDKLKFRYLEYKQLAIHDKNLNNIVNILETLLLEIKCNFDSSYIKAYKKYLESIQNKINTIAVIMDGNRRWAKENKTDLKTAYSKGIKKCIDSLYWCIEREIPNLAVFAFSSDNWKRDVSEKEEILEQLKTFYHSYVDNFICLNIKVKFIGQINRFDSEIQTIINSITDKTKNGSKCTLWVALSYNGKDEIIEAIKNYKSETTDINSLFWTKEMPEVDILIRTGGGKRLSGFLLWKISYAELFFKDVLWPDFSEEIFDEIIVEFLQTERKMGA